MSARLRRLEAIVGKPLVSRSARGEAACLSVRHGDIEAIKTATIHCMGPAFLSRWSVENELGSEESVHRFRI